MVSANIENAGFKQAYFDRNTILPFSKTDALKRGMLEFNPSVLKLPAHSSSAGQTGRTNGFWFIAPTDFILTNGSPSKYLTSIDIHVLDGKTVLPEYPTAEGYLSTPVYSAHRLSPGEEHSIDLLIRKSQMVAVLAKRKNTSIVGSITGGEFISNIGKDPITLRPLISRDIHRFLGKPYRINSLKRDSLGLVDLAWVSL